MRVYKWMAAMACLGLMGTGCAEDGKDGATGATGPAGAQGEQGEKGDTGDQGPAGAAGAQGDKGDKGDKGDDGEDGLCAGVPQLAIDGVLGNADPVFPGEVTEVELDFTGGGDKVEVQFISTATMLNGMATIPSAPMAGAGPGLFDITPEFEGDYTFVAIATDGCTVATTTFDLKVRSALVSIVHVFGGAGQVGFAVRGTEQILFQQVQGQLGPQTVAAIGPGQTFPGYFRIPQSSIDLDLFPATGGVPDLTAAPTQLPTLNLVPDGRYIVAAYGDAEGDLAVAVFTPDQSMIDSMTDARVQFAHLAGGVGPVDISATSDMATPLFSDVAPGTLTAGALLAVADYTVFVDTDEDAEANIEVGLPLETSQVLPGDYVIVIAWIDAAANVRMLVHDTGGDGTQYESQVFQFPGTVTVFLPPPDVTWTLPAATAVPGTDPAELEVTMTVDGPDGCTLAEIYLDYTMDPQGFTYNNEVIYTLTSPTGTVVELGAGTGNNGNLESGRFNGTVGFAGETVDGDWTLLIEDTWGDGVAISNLLLSVYCAD